MSSTGHNILTAIVGSTQWEHSETQQQKLRNAAAQCANCPFLAYIGISLSTYNMRNAHQYRCTACNCKVARRIVNNSCPKNRF